MTSTELVDRLANHKTIGAAPRQELEWLAAHGTLRRLEVGDTLSTRGAPVEGLFVVLSGRIAIFIDRGSGPHKLAEWRDGDVTGLLPYSRLVAAPGRSLVQEPSEVLVVPREHMNALARECHELTSILVHRMIDRAREFTSNELHDEKMISLGRLSAGLAHELNNPASAIERSAALFANRLEDAEQAARALATAGLTVSQFDAIDGVRNACAAAPEQGVRSPIEHAEREEAITGWLAGRGLDTAAAEALAETAVTTEALDRLSGAVQGPALNAALRWAAAGCSLRRLASEIQEAATRIAGLVLAVKGFTHMDQATVAEPVDLAKSLANTVAVLKSKARGKSVAVSVKVDPGLPRVRGFVGELNQIWGNLIDNALDAVPESGRVEVEAGRESRRVVVRIADNGPGIPAEIRDRIFDPFFTTKAAGQGTGLGLDIVRRLVQHNEGEIAVESRPGRTEFQVTLPLAEIEGAEGRA
ncbi:MAG TPA: ATP-binding protein [Thermoanaerobaculia bacterium]|nr:ATP-binding protein [Thermoanaerobaculia bacterium]